jgi:hypothetical protein
VLIGVGIYGLMDSFGAFDGIKEAIGANDDVILKKQHDCLRLYILSLF